MSIQSIQAKGREIAANIASLYRITDVDVIISIQVSGIVDDSVDDVNAGTFQVDGQGYISASIAEGKGIIVNTEFLNFIAGIIVIVDNIVSTELPDT